MVDQKWERVIVLCVRQFQFRKRAESARFGKQGGWNCMEVRLGQWASTA